MKALIVGVFLFSAPAWAINPSYKTWDGVECLIIKDGRMVPCDKWMLADIERAKPQERPYSCSCSRNCSSCRAPMWGDQRK